MHHAGWMALAAMSAALAMGDARADDEPALTQLETVVVSGIQPGPGLWQVKRDGHRMWVLGTLTPLPKRMQWESLEVEERIAQSQEVIYPPTAELTVKGGIIGGLFLLPSLLKARDNPDKQALKDVVPAEDYARWTVLKRKYLPRNRDVEKRRPIFASGALFEKAIDNAGLSFDDRVLPVVKKAARRSKVAVTRPSIEIRIEKARAALKDFRSEQLDDVACFRLTVERLEGDVTAMRGWANAWATGDVEALRDLPYQDQIRACVDAVLRSELAKDRGFADLRQRVEQVWLEAAEKAIAKNETSFAILPMSQVMRDDGILARLAAKGYEIVPPKPRVEADAEEAAAVESER